MEEGRKRGWGRERMRANQTLGSDLSTGNSIWLELDNCCFVAFVLIFMLTFYLE